MTLANISGGIARDAKGQELLREPEFAVCNAVTR
jgi:hypothetical protein